MISNPFADLLIAPTAGVIGGLLGVALGVLAIVRRGRLGGDVLWARWRVWAAIAPVWTLAVLGGPLPILVLVLGLTVQGLREYAALVGLPTGYRRVLLGCGSLAAPAALVSPDALGLLPPVLLVLATLQPVLSRSREGAIRHLAFAALGWGYVAWFLAHLVLVHRHVAGGPGILLALGLGICLSDVGAFASGKLLGRHKLAPALSPNKTWEGVGGNVLGAYIGIGAMWFALPAVPRAVLLLLMPMVVALGAVWGDLLESGIKREFGAKDAGAWLPGFGGLLDRIDSLLLVAPLAYYALRLLG